MKKDKKILIVDDSESTIRLASDILSPEYPLVHASSGEEAISTYAKERPDLVLSALRMPGLSGFELQLILQGQFHEQIPFIFMTENPNDEVESIGFRNGAMDFIRKPFRADVLLKRLDGILGNIDRIRGLTQAAVTDRMTGLLNKASAESEVSALCRETPGALMVINLDSFKSVNDLHGHSMGDRILMEFADIIRSVVRSTDVVGRLGGDEFIAYCQHVVDEEVVSSKTEYLNNRILEEAKRHLGDDMSIALGVSVGCVFAPAEGTDYTELFLKAGRALHVVKKNGRHGYNVFREAEQENAAGGKGPSLLADTVEILAERDRSKGAMNLPLESFQLLYRFLGRVNVNYHRFAWILLFRLSLREGYDFSLSEATKTLSETLVSSLRVSDVVTTPGNGQCLVLLLEAEHSSIGLVVTRFLRNWEQTESGQKFDISYEVAQIEK